MYSDGRDWPHGGQESGFCGKCLEKKKKSHPGASAQSANRSLHRNPVIVLASTKIDGFAKLRPPSTFGRQKNMEAVATFDLTPDPSHLCLGRTFVHPTLEWPSLCPFDATEKGVLSRLDRA